MATSIMVPVDLAHKDAAEPALTYAGQLANLNNAKLTLVGVTGPTTSEAAHNPAEFQEKLAAFAKDVADRTGLSVNAQALLDNDVAVDLGNVLIKAATSLGVDLIVMTSHVPGFIEHIIASNAGYVASHAKCSVFVVR